MYRAILAVLDKADIRMSVIERDTFASLERVTFQINTNRAQHAALLAALKESDTTDQVMSFQDTEQD